MRLHNRGLKFGDEFFNVEFPIHSNYRWEFRIQPESAPRLAAVLNKYGYNFHMRDMDDGTTYFYDVIETGAPVRQ